jgi:hypothetical protein
MCKSPKSRSCKTPAKERNKRQSPLDRAAKPLPESPVSLACGDVVPHIVVQSPRPRLGEFETHPAKRLLQHYLPTRDSCTGANSISILSPRLREQPTPLGRAGELDEVLSQAAKTGAIGNARKAAR